MRTRVRGSPVSERAADEDCFPALLPRRRRGLALKEVIKSPEVDIGGLILSHESRAPSICTALCTARKIANIGILGRERTCGDGSYTRTQWICSSRFGNGCPDPIN
jgi:hypothetical protein